MSRSGLIPRSFWYLLAAAALAGGWLVLGGGQVDELATLVPMTASDVVRITVRNAESTYDMTLAADGWTLDGDCRDHIDDTDVNSLISDLVSVPRSAEPVAVFELSSGSQYGLTDVRALTLTMESVQGERHEVTIGGVNEVTGTAYVLSAGDDDVYLTAGDVRGWLNALPNAVRDDDVWPGFEKADADTIELSDAGRTLIFARDDLKRWWLRDDGLPASGVAVDYVQRFDDRTLMVSDARWLRADDRALRNLDSALADAIVNVFHRAGRHAQPAPAAGRRLRAAKRGAEAHVLVLGDVNDLYIDAWRDGCDSGLVMNLDVDQAATDLLASPLRDEVLTHGLAFADSFVLELTGWPVLTVAKTAGNWEPMRMPGADRDYRNQIRDMAVLIDRLTMIRLLAPEPAAEHLFGEDYRLTLTTWHSISNLPVEQTMVFGISKQRDRLLGWRASDGFVCEVPREVITSARALVSGLR